MLTIRISSNQWVLLGVIGCFLLSGFAALVYQTAWMRQFSLVFGTSELAVAAVLSAYMGGLALGANLAARYIDRITKPVLYYGVLEAGIAISALSVPLLLSLTSWLYVVFLGGQAEPAGSGGWVQSAFYLVFAFIILAIPTAFMGATLPLLTKYAVRSKEHIGSRVGMLYAFNTAGAIVGTLVAGFILLPLVGLKGTVYVGVVINFLVFLIAIKIAKQADKIEPQETAQKKKVKASKLAPARLVTAKWILPIMLFSGIISFIYEVLWTRLLGHVLGGSVIAFSTMLAGFLSGIAIGSAIASRFAKSKFQAMSLFVICQMGIALMSILVYAALPSMLPEGVGGLRGNVLMALAVLLPATLFIGATFPFAVRILARDIDSAAPASAKVYSWNTVGAIIGATVAAFFIIPMLKYEGAIKLAVLSNLILAVLVSLFVFKEKNVPKTKLSELSRLSMPVSFFAVIAVLFLYKPLMPEEVLRSSPVALAESGEVTFYEVGRSATVLLVEEDSYSNIRTNGLPEASITLKGSPPFTHNQRMLATLPVLIRPDIESILVVGLGGGVVLEDVPKSIDSIDVIELEPEVINANIAISDKRLFDPLSDERINLIENDARSALALTDKKYGAIVSQPSHPWTAGASHLYTREFMQLANNHLVDDGIFLQWMNSQFVDEALLRSLTATMLDVFPHVRMYQWNPEILFFVGSRQPMQPELAMIQTGRPLTDDISGYLNKGVGVIEDMVIALAMDHDSAVRFAEGAPINTDNNNLMAARSVRVIGTDEALLATRLFDLLRDYDPLLSATSDIRATLAPHLDYAYISRRLDAHGFRQRSSELLESLQETDTSVALQIIAARQQVEGSSQEAQTNFGLSIIENPQNHQARFAFLLPWFDAYRQNRELPDTVANEFDLLSGTALAVFNAWIAVQTEGSQGAAPFEEQLAQVQPTDVWYESSLQLRAHWRSQITTPSLRIRYAEEIISLVDRAIIFNQTPEWYVMRLQAALTLGDQDIIFQTAYYLHQANQLIFSQMERSGETQGARLTSVLRQELMVEAALNWLLANSSINRGRAENLLGLSQSSISTVRDLIP